jgi:hypothetical protein
MPPGVREEGRIAGESPRAAHTEEAPIDAPLPRGAGLITEFFPFDHASLDESLTRLLDRFVDEATPNNGRTDPLPYPVLFLTAVVALEATRRWRNRLSASWASEEWKKGSPSLHGLS